MKKLIMLMFLLQNLYAADFIAYNTIGPVKFTVKNISVLNSSSLSPQKKLALIKAYTSTVVDAYDNQQVVYFGIDIGTDEGKLLYTQFEKAYWFQQDILVRCLSTVDRKPADAVKIFERGNPQGVTYPFWTPVIAWTEFPAD